jgi:MFS family permease
MAASDTTVLETPHRALITVCLTISTLMQALDSTIANVALPYMQGSLSASYDQITWVLTSYVVMAVIMTAPVGWPLRALRPEKSVHYLPRRLYDYLHAGRHHRLAVAGRIRRGARAALAIHPAGYLPARSLRTGILSPA